MKDAYAQIPFTVPGSDEEIVPATGKNTHNKAKTNKPDKPTADHIGHRERLRQKLLRGDDSLLDHEVIEFMLMLAIPRRDTKPMAKALLRRFGSLAGVLSADVAALSQVDGIGKKSAAVLKIAQIAAKRLLYQPAMEQPILSSWQALMDYLHADMAHLGVERVRVLYLNSKNMLISNEKIGDGTVDQAAIYTRSVIKRALDLNAVAVILVHNHPSGDPHPSQEDIRITRDIIEAGRRLKVIVHDHVIIGREGHFSMKAKGLI